MTGSLGSLGASMLLQQLTASRQAPANQTTNSNAGRFSYSDAIRKKDDQSQETQETQDEDGEGGEVEEE